MVTYEALFAFTQTLLLTATSVAGIITLVITIIKLNDKNDKRKK